MTVTLSITGQNAEEVRADLQRLFPGMLPPMQEQPMPPVHPSVSEINAAVDKTLTEIVEAPKTRKRGKKDEQIDIEQAIAEAPPLADAAAEPSAGASSEPETSSSSAVDVPDIEAVRAKLKELGATEGLGHDKVFEVLGKYKAKNASTVAESDRAALIAEIDALLTSQVA